MLAYYPPSFPPHHDRECACGVQCDAYGSVEPSIRCDSIGGPCGSRLTRESRHHARGQGHVPDDVVISVNLRCRGKGEGRECTKGERERRDTEWGESPFSKHKAQPSTHFASPCQKTSRQVRSKRPPMTTPRYSNCNSRMPTINRRAPKMYQRSPSLLLRRLCLCMALLPFLLTTTANVPAASSAIPWGQ